MFIRGKHMTIYEAAAPTRPCARSSNPPGTPACTRESGVGAFFVASVRSCRYKWGGAASLHPRRLVRDTFQDAPGCGSCLEGVRRSRVNCGLRATEPRRFAPGNAVAQCVRRSYLAFRARTPPRLGGGSMGACRCRAGSTCLARARLVGAFDRSVPVLAFWPGQLKGMQSL